MPLRASIWLALIVLAAAGCGGGTLSRKALQKQAESIQSLAAEGTLSLGCGLAQAHPLGDDDMLVMCASGGTAAVRVG